MTREQSGFTLVELLIAVAVLGILAAVVIPAAMRGRVAANESATLGDIRTLISAQTAYQSANHGHYDSALSCLTAPSFGCIPSYPTSAPTFLDSLLAAQNAKAGYNRSFSWGSIVNVDPLASATSTNAYRYDATPIVVGQTGVRGFAADYTGRVCFTPDGTAIVPSGPQLPANCQNLR